jgi:hypothetical protein
VATTLSTGPHQPVGDLVGPSCGKLGLFFFGGLAWACCVGVDDGWNLDP